MNATLTARHMNMGDNYSSFNGGMMTSLFFHAVMIAFAIFGLPHIKKPPTIPETAISIDIIDLPVDEIAQTNKPPVQAPAPKEPPKIEEQVAKKKEAPKMPPKVEAKEPPKAVPVKPPPPEPPKKIVKPIPKVPPPPAEALKEPEPEPKKEEVVEEEPQQEQFQSLLKNLQDAEPQPDVPDINPKAQNAAPSPLAQFSQQMTMSEFDALRRQLARCWSIQAGARYAEDLVVEVKLKVGPDRRVINAMVVDQFRYSNDSYFRAAADSAIRAVHSPMCDPLDVPEDKYDVWKDMIVNFDPREML